MTGAGPQSGPVWDGVGEASAEDELAALDWENNVLPGLAMLAEDAPTAAELAEERAVEREAAALVDRFRPVDQEYWQRVAAAERAEAARAEAAYDRSGPGDPAALAVVSAALVERQVAAQRWEAGLGQLREVGLGLRDVWWHDGGPPPQLDVDAGGPPVVEREVER